MSFTKGFEKVAKSDLAGRIAKGIAEGIHGVKSFGEGVHAAGADTLGHTLKLQGLKALGEGTKAHGGFSAALKTPEGRQAVAKALGRAAPSVGAAGLYTGALYKGYKKMTEPSYDQQYYYQ